MDLNSDGVIDKKDFSLAGKVLSQAKNYDYMSKETEKEVQKQVDHFEVGDEITVKYNGKNTRAVVIEKVKQNDKKENLYLAKMNWYHEKLVVSGKVQPKKKAKK